ncbi:hypothetical protein [Stieleria varia]|uniref:Acyl carrier protein phosphodiesterase n=1 Tax=Stieleria varia TaxID=2528005 RepID=A0A5C6AGS7_9BACT|nr:hypothetical protein [Stieleria varia]TWT98650.1 hypothetical protein Pla52n_51670 [Stieleria varia]
MNFLCHAMPYFDEPLVAISTGVPDWLSVIDRKIRARGRSAMLHLNSPDDELRQVAQGILHHVNDDRWFHSTAAFVETNMALAVQLRDRLPGDEGFRPTFVGHILIEIFLDAFWLRDRAEIGRQYYALFDEQRARIVQRCVNVITGKPTDRLAETMLRFADSRFLLDYLDPEKLLMRLNQVMKRVNLPLLPDTLLPWLTEAGEMIESRRRRFLTRADGTSHIDLPFHSP